LPCSRAGIAPGLVCESVAEQVGAVAQVETISHNKSETIFEKIAASRNFFVEPTANQGERGMNREFQQYRFARIEAQNITKRGLKHNSRMESAALKRSRRQSSNS
jgi:hypothetical protein